MNVKNHKTIQELTEELALAKRRIEALEELEASRLKTEQALRESERKTRAILDQTFQFIGLMKPDGTLIDANRTSLNFGGLKESDVIGQLFWETPWWSHSTELQQKLKDGTAKAAAGELVRFEAHHPNLEGGTSFVDVSLKPVRNDSGEIIYIIPEGRDITDLKQAEEEIQKLALAVMHSGELVNMASLEGQMIFLNHAGQQMLGIDPDQVTSTNIMEVIPEHLVPLVTGDLIPTLMKGQNWKGELQYVNLKTGKLKDVHAITYTVPDQTTSAPLFLANVSMDITDLKRAEKERQALQTQIQQIQKLESLGVLAGGIAHDFNNLLTGIAGNAELALIQTPQDSQSKNNIEAIQQASRQAADLCQQMLAYSGKGRFETEVLHPAQIAKDTAQMIRVTISKKVSLTYDFKDDAKPIEADASQLGQVILNLISNASEAIGDNIGEIAVRIGTEAYTHQQLSSQFIDEELTEGDYTYIEVSDTGQGMSSDVLVKIFDPFFSTKFTGRGLGLSSVLGIIRGHRGAIKVSSEPGKGTCIRAVFPAVETLPTAPSKETEPRDPWRGTGTVLLVDDEEIVRNTGISMLKNMGFDVISAADGVNALELFRQKRDEIVLILLDLTMPRMDGVQTLVELRKIRKDIPIVLCSGYAETDVSQQFGEEKVVTFLKKPFSLKDLVAKARQLLD